LVRQGQEGIDNSEFHSNLLSCRRHRMSSCDIPLDQEQSILGSHRDHHRMAHRVSVERQVLVAVPVAETPDYCHQGHLTACTHR
jgi:hypothetical protein